MDFENYLKCAFKKLKSSICFDKTQVIFRDSLVRYENDSIDKNLKVLENLLTGPKENWSTQVQLWLDTIEVLVYPKSVKNANTFDGLTFNRIDKSFEVDKMQHMFNSCVELQLLGILWIMIFGQELDKNISDHAYGNRLKKRLFEDDEMSKLSPHLFHPYFELYESWRDEGLEIAEKSIDNDKDIVVFTMDLKRYYYNVRLSKKQFREFESSILDASSYTTKECNSLKRINRLIFDVIKKYSDILEDYTDDLKNVDSDACLPIGYFPSAILSNWYLKDFDNAIVSKWNPLYYGRYVDDFLIVDKVEKDSVLQKRANSNNLTREFIIDFFMCNCQSEHFSKCEKDKILMKKEISHMSSNDGEKENTIIDYYINVAHLPTAKQLLCVQNSKVKSYYFHSNGNKQLLQSFRKELNENRSEWRFLPEEEETLFDQTYDSIYEIQREHGATVNKFREIDNITLHKYSLSKYLGKLSFTTGLIKDNTPLHFEDDLLKIFDQKTVIENFIFWERLFEVFFRKRNFKKSLEFSDHVMKSIAEMKISSTIDNTEHPILDYMQKTLFRVFIASITRPLSLVWGKDVTEFCNELEIMLMQTSWSISEIGNNLLDIRKQYCETRMFNKNICPIPIDFLQKEKIYSDKTTFSLSDFNKCTSLIIKPKDDNSCLSDLDLKQYRYHPYVVSLQDIEYACNLSNIYGGRISDFSDIGLTMRVFEFINGFTADAEKNIAEVKFKEKDYLKDIGVYTTQVITQSCKNSTETEYLQTPFDKSINIAVANVKLEGKNFKDVLLGQPNRSSKRYGRLRKVVNQAIEENVDVLVMPEAYLPIEWIPALTRRATKNKIAIITGVEWVIRNYKMEKEIVNLTATILPYTTEKGDTYAHIHLHHKVHYAPEEARQIIGHGFTYREGKRYDLFNYNHFWFSVYCCCELIAIKERSLFMGYEDALLVVEWNKDTNYFSNIIESLSRDIHCYCVQVNTSEYGDSRIIAPKKTELKDIVRTKGGINDTIIIGTLNIEALREFQILSYDLQKSDGSYKTTPPTFPTDKVKSKRERKLFDTIAPT